MTNARHTVGSLACIAVVLLRVEHAHAGCTNDPETGLGFYDPVPAMGTTAPRNTKIWVPPMWSDDELSESQVAIKADGAPLATTVTSIVVDGEINPTVLVFTPAKLLTVGSMISVTVSGHFMTQFTVGADEDVSAPEPPSIVRVDVEGAYDSTLSCQNYAHADVTVANEDALLVLTDVATTEMPSSVVAISNWRLARAEALAEGEHSLHVLTVDVAGNASASRPVPVFAVPAAQSGCSVGGGAGPSVFGALAMLVLWGLRRRAARSRRV